MKYYISNWQDWKELCERWNIDPYEYIDFKIDKGGGNIRDFKYIGDFPDKGERMSELRSKRRLVSRGYKFGKSYIAHFRKFLKKYIKEIEVEEKKGMDTPNPICKKCKYWVSMPVGCTLDDECPHNPFTKE